MAEFELPEPTGLFDTVGSNGEDTRTPYWETPFQGMVTAWIGGLEIEGVYREDLEELRRQALVVLAAVEQAEQFAAAEKGSSDA